MMRIQTSVLFFTAVICLQLHEGSADGLLPGQCRDKVACKLYSSTICTDPQYYNWALENCPNHCNMCTGVAVPIGEGKVMPNMKTNTNPSCTDRLTNCADYGTHMCEDVKFYTWIMENCRAHCNRCSMNCEDAIPNCGDYGDTLCTELSYYNWVEMHCRKYCARCTA